ncbi:hypothetical protein GCM10027580_05840 [Corynebacterium faecale]
MVDCEIGLITYEVKTGVLAGLCKPSFRLSGADSSEWEVRYGGHPWPLLGID